MGYKTNTLASDAYEAWQNGRPIYYCDVNGDEWAVSCVTADKVAIIYWQNEVAYDFLITTPFSGNYLVKPASLLS